MRRTVLTSLVIAVLAAAVPLISQAPATESPVVELKLLIDGATRATVRVRAGERVKLSAPGETTVALVPTIHEGSLNLRVVALASDIEAMKNGVDEGRYELARHVPQTVTARDMCIEVEWSDLITSEAGCSFVFRQLGCWLCTNPFQIKRDRVKDADFRVAL